MKPVRIFLLLLFIFLFFGFLSLVIPNGSIRINPVLSIQIPSMEKIFQSQDMEYADIASILEQKRTDLDSIVKIVKMDTVKGFDSLSIRLVSQPLDYPEGDKSVLYPFFRALEESQRNKQGIHILHYGDSQLEGDRITDYLRMRFQAEFGGSGPGMLPIGEEEYTLALLSSVSGNWKKYNLMGTRVKDQGSHPFGPLGCFSRFEPYENDTSGGRIKTEEAWVTFRPKDIAGARTGQYQRCRIFYENYQKPVNVRFFNGDTEIRSDTLTPTLSLKKCELTFQVTPAKLTLRFKGSESPDFYGICLDSTSGISVDNIPIRGSAGLEFTRMSPTLMEEIFNTLNVKLLILQFGVNVIPGDLDDYTYYENGLYVQICQLQKVNPGLPIIVIGVSDASRKNGSAYESYPCVEKILKAQKSAAFKAGCVFWNLYDAMGGKNSMPSWVFAKEPLASTDFLHFNYAGARIVGKMFYSALINDYNEFIRKDRP